MNRSAVHTVHKHQQLHILKLDITIRLCGHAITTHRLGSTTGRTTSRENRNGKKLDLLDENSELKRKCVCICGHVVSQSLTLSLTSFLAEEYQVGYFIRANRVLSDSADMRSALLQLLLVAYAHASQFIDCTAPVVPAQPIPNAPPVKAPNGDVLGITTRSYTLNGSPVFLSAGEIHPSRLPVSEWLPTLRKMKAGGLQAVSSYIFWLHVSQAQGQQDWSGSNNVTAFLNAASQAGLYVALRIGPWAHGEARNGGFPDWLQQTGVQLRTNNTAFLSYVREWYTGLAAQLKGQMFQDGGPVITVQLDNETPDVSYLVALRELAVSCGILPPFFTKTAWPSPDQPVPPGSMLPLLGGYQDEFWGCSQQPSINSETMFSNQSVYQAPGDIAYPVLNVELGGGMASSAQRRIYLPSIVTGAAMHAALGSGVATIGMYMYAGVWHVYIIIAVQLTVL